MAARPREIVTKEIRITVSDAEHEALKEKKNGRTWYEVLRDGADCQVEA